VKTFAASALLVLLAALPSFALTQLLAMRVDLEVVRGQGENTVVSLVVQVAPEDRKRAGRRLWLEAELRQGDVVVEQVARVVELDRQGRSEVELALPPGEYALRAEVSGSTDEIAGFWEGVVDVPAFDTGETAVQEVTAAATIGEVAEPPARPPSAEVPDEPAVATTAAAVAPTEVADVEEDMPAGEAATVPAEAAAATPEAAVAPPDPEPEPPPTRPPPDSPPAEPAAPAPVATVAAGWSETDPDLVDVTVSTMAHNRPVTRLERSAFELEVGGKPAEIERFGDASEAPLSLVLVVAGSLGQALPEVKEQLSRFALRVVGGAGGLSLVLADPGPRVALDWGAGPADLADALDGAVGSAAGNVAGMVEVALAQVQERVGRAVVLVLADGRAAATRDEWRRAAVGVDASGAQILFIGFRGGLDKKARRELESLAEASGGKSYLIRDAGLLGMVLDHYAELIQASYALSFRRAVSGGEGPVKIKVRVVGGQVEVHHPDRVR